MRARDLLFEGLSAPVRTVNCEELIEGLAGYVPRWPYSVGDKSETEACALLAFNGEAWLIQSPHTKAPRVHKTAVNAVCDLLSVLASALIAEQPGLLCFHSAALELNGELVLFPAVRRSGKSTLSAVLMARGAGLFTDDYLPVERTRDGGLEGRATGIAARLRLPLPGNLPADARAHIAANSGPRNSQYLYLSGPAVRPAGRRRPIRSIILLDRQDTGKSTLSDVPEGELLGRLAHQNFSRGSPAGETLTALIGLARTAPALRLTYSDPGEAADRILSLEPRGQAAAQPEIAFPTPGPRPDRAAFDPERVYRRTSFAKLREAGEVWVGASCDGRQILKFDAAAIGVLELFEEPMRPTEVLGLIEEAFPAADPAELEKNTFSIIRNFLKVGYIARC